MSNQETPAPKGRGWTRGERIVVVTALLLAADLFFLPWHHFSLDFGQLGVQVPSFSFERTGVQDPRAAFGIAATVIALGMAIHMVATKLSAAVPRLDQFHLIAGAVVLGLLLAKLIADRQFLGIGAWVGTGLAVGLAYGGYDLSQESPAGSGTAAPGPNRLQ